ncbi:MAG: phosphate/phosphite/phosphonate ABC transporter substrate-binding protein, partial [Oceanospirillales bacterium]
MRAVVLLSYILYVSFLSTAFASSVVSLSPQKNASNKVSSQSLILGVFAYRPDLVMISHYQPLVEYLNEALGDEYILELRILNDQQMQEALRHNQLDFVLTNPSHFLVLRSQTSMSGVLATLVRNANGIATSASGGVIFVRNESPVNTLDDLKGKSIAIPEARFLGGYQAQIYELLQHNIDVQQLVFAEFSTQDQVINAVLNGSAEVGFVRTGMIEDWQKHDFGSVDQLRVINEQNLRGFPYRLSTRLYPEWPLLSLPHLDPEVIRLVANA